MIIEKIFLFCQRLGYHITPNHFYFPIPDTSKLKDYLWLRHSELIGINMKDKKQLELLSVFTSKFKKEYDLFSKKKTSKRYEYYLDNEFFPCVDGEILYCIIRYFKPKKIFEIGSGFSTYLSAKAILKNREEDDSYDCKLVAIEPFPNETIKAGFPGLSKLIIKKVQDVPLSYFKKLESNDILFIDSSHVLKIGSDVQYEYLKILPRLNKGVIIHFHDIFLPAEYPKEWILREYRFWNEQYFLQTFLTFNYAFEVLWAVNYMNSKYPDKLEKAFNSYKKNISLPGSFWIKRIK